MVNKNTSWKIVAAGLTVCFLFSMQLCFGQSLQTITDRKDIIIGEQIKLKIKATVPATAAGSVKWFAIPDSIPHFDIVESGKPDTTNFKDDSKTIEQTITVTSFDSGSWVFPQLAVAIAATGGQPAQVIQTDSFRVNVSYSPADSTNQLRDIKPIIKVSVSDYFWYYIIVGALLLLLVIILLYRYFIKKKQAQPVKSVSGLSPFDEAMEGLKKLNQLNLQDAAEIKTYHITLAALFKNYLGRKQAKNLMHETTGDLLISISSNTMQPEAVSKLATALRCTDAVKFAKYLPLSNESEDCLQKIKETITAIESSKLLNSKPIN